MSVWRSCVSVGWGTTAPRTNTCNQKGIKTISIEWRARYNRSLNASAAMSSPEVKETDTLPASNITSANSSWPRGLKSVLNATFPTWDSLSSIEPRRLTKTTSLPSENCVPRRSTAGIMAISRTLRRKKSKMLTDSCSWAKKPTPRTFTPSSSSTIRWRWKKGKTVGCNSHVFRNGRRVPRCLRNWIDLCADPQQTDRWFLRPPKLLPSTAFTIFLVSSLSNRDSSTFLLTWSSECKTSLFRDPNQVWCASKSCIYLILPQCQECKVDILLMKKFARLFKDDFRRACTSWGELLKKAKRSLLTRSVSVAESLWLRPVFAPTSCAARSTATHVHRDTTPLNDALTDAPWGSIQCFSKPGMSGSLTSVHWNPELRKNNNDQR